MPRWQGPFPPPPGAKNHYLVLRDLDRARRARTFDALIASMNESVLGLEIALHAISRRRLAEASNG